MRGRLAWLVVVAGCGDNGLGSNEPLLDRTPLVTAEDTAIARELDAVDADGDDLAFAIVTPPAHGSAGLTAAKLTYSPEPNYFGPDAIEVTAFDGLHLVYATIEVEVTPVNDPPAGLGDSLAAVEDTLVATSLAALLANDTDVDGDVLEVVSVRNPVHGLVAIQDGEVFFLPDTNFSGTATYEYLVTDGTVRVPVTVGVAVGTANDPPSAVDDALTATEDIPRLIGGAALVSNDVDPDGQTLSVTEVANATNGTVALVGGNVTFTPEPNFSGTASFDYTVTDGAETDIAHVEIVVGPVDDRPIAVDDALTSAENTVLVIPAADLVANDTDIDGPALEVVAIQNAISCEAVLADGMVTFTPPADFFGTASFEYVVSDGARTDVGLVTVTVAAVAVCGNNETEPPEECDDGNTDDGDGCSAICQKELVSIAIAPGPVAIDQQQRVQLRAIATLFGGGTRDVTATADWTTDLPAIATVGTGGTANGRVDGLTTGAATIGASVGSVGSTTVVTVGAATCTIKINEVQTRGDGTSSQADEFAELVNPCTFDVDVTGWNLVYRGATAIVDATGITSALTGVFPAGTFRLYAGVAYNGPETQDGTFGSTANGFADAGGGVAIRSGPLNTGAVVDAVAWGTAANAFASGPNAPPAPATQSFGRQPHDGADTDAAGTDFVVTSATTPRSTNVP